MDLLDYILVAAVVGYCVWVVFFRKKKGTCCGNCAKCGGYRK